MALRNTGEEELILLYTSYIVFLQYRVISSCFRTTLKYCCNAHGRFVFQSRTKVLKYTLNSPVYQRAVVVGVSSVDVLVGLYCLENTLVLVGTFYRFLLSERVFWSWDLG